MRSKLLASKSMLLLCGALIVSCAGAAEPLSRDPAEILRKVIANSTGEEARRAELSHAYTRNTMVLAYNDDGKVRKQTERVYEVFPEDGEAMMKLVMVNGKPVAPELSEPRNNYSKAGDNAKKLEFDEELIQRYHFQYEREESIGGRTFALLSFVPKADPPDDGGMFGKLLNELAGQVWVDREDYQLARLQVKLLRKVSFFGGIAGNVEKMELRLVRERVAPGVWLNSSTHIDFEGRKLFSRVRFEAFENCSSFRLAGTLARHSAR